MMTHQRHLHRSLHPVAKWLAPWRPRGRERHEAVEINWHIIEAFELDVVLGDSDECRHHYQFISTARCKEFEFIASLKKPAGFRENRLEPSLLVGLPDGSRHGLALRKLEQWLFRTTREPCWRAAPKPSCRMLSMPSRRCAAPRLML